MKRKTYFIKEKCFMEMYNLAKDIHSNTSLISMFCNAYEDVDEFYQILPVLKYTGQLTDKLYACFIDIKK